MSWAGGGSGLPAEGSRVDKPRNPGHHPAFANALTPGAAGMSFCLPLAFYQDRQQKKGREGRSEAQEPLLGAREATVRATSLGLSWWPNAPLRPCTLARMCGHACPARSGVAVP